MQRGELRILVSERRLHTHAHDKKNKSVTKNVPMKKKNYKSKKPSQTNVPTCAMATHVHNKKTSLAILLLALLSSTTSILFITYLSDSNQYSVVSYETATHGLTHTRRGKAVPI